MKNTAKNFLFGGLEKSDSPFGSVNLIDLKKSARLLLVVVAGTGLTAGLDFLSQWILGADLGPYKIFVMPVISAGFEIARRWVSTNLVAPTE